MLPALGEGPSLERKNAPTWHGEGFIADLPAQPFSLSEGLLVPPVPLALMVGHPWTGLLGTGCALDRGSWV